MTPLIDVIFLLLLFFMLSSTFSRYSDVEMDLGASGGGAVGPDEVAFLRLGPEAVELNGRPLALEALVAGVAALDPETMVVSLRDGVTAQRLTDLLVTLRALPQVELVLLGDG
jgi:biopolymer transport protein ExbD